MFIRNDMDVSYVRVFHASPNGPSVDIYVNGGLAFKNLQFKDFTEYVQLPMGEYKIEVFSAGQKETPILTQSIRLPEKEVVTIAAVGNFEDLQLIPYIEGNADDLFEDESRVRIIHLSPDAPNVDVLIDGNLAFTDIGFMDATDYVQLLSDSYNLTVNLADTKDTVLTLNTDLKSQKVYTIYVVGNPPNLLGMQSLDGSTFVRFK
ncbi:MAG: DUF4397 domain-containing protein [Terrisporobacter othiniensis]|uniref:DUF4397 domain-containing protein n=1 Tax=Terrisporobacter hibernicus TaxID=2813371 RepID=A0AAX2ZE21_9FIRM|nr:MULTISPECIES: DUF4397 domain-containing protein [Terrisporobacter]MBN9646707.1 DUF4397 domain-containing protein [Terrisporobacter glycolicus]MDU4859934.1 DUF4397 domain-containing protein [Terrisporobacter othiniensis]MDU6996420.1 DUF4397 domain-containing protein [Terrisporobacter othiniensis]UEL46647.1 DUF4397 domain-containing protein [Terrisporobacter hibernicus]HBI93544.1 DUF4397 domain-containing protein [Terrisporobacter hibernicus]